MLQIFCELLILFSVAPGRRGTSQICRCPFQCWSRKQYCVKARLTDRMIVQEEILQKDQALTRVCAGWKCLDRIWRTGIYGAVNEGSICYYLEDLLWPIVFIGRLVSFWRLMLSICICVILCLSLALGDFSHNSHNRVFLQPVPNRFV